MTSSLVVFTNTEVPIATGTSKWVGDKYAELNLSTVVDAVTKRLFWFVIFTQVTPIDPDAVKAPGAYKK